MLKVGCAYSYVMYVIVGAYSLAMRLVVVVQYFASLQNLESVIWMLKV